MAHLLGRQDCVESLRKDLVDLQGTVLDVFSRTGPVRFPSWKFPDKLSCDLDLVSLLDQYDYVDGEDEFNQHAHIVLLELVIDRLLLLLQSFNAHAEQMRIEQCQQTGPCVSIGLVVRYYWNNLVQLVSQQGMTKDSQKVTKPSKHKEVNISPAPSVRSCGDLRAGSSTSGKTESAHCVGTPRNQVSRRSFSEASRTAIAHNTPPVSSDTRSVSCQTVESCLVPCDACAHVQASLRETGDALVELCRTEGLPSSLQRLLGAVDESSAQGRLTAADLAQWSTEQRRDVGRLGKHLQEIRATVQPLREGLQTAEGEREGWKAQLQSAREEMQQEREEHQASMQQQQQRLLEVQTSWVETERRLQEEQEKLRRGIVSLEDNNSKFKEDITLLQERSRALELERDRLQEEATSLRKEENSRDELEEKIHVLESRLSSTQLALDKESAKYQSACRQQESMQAKQGSLLERVDALDQECEELQKQLDEGEDRQTDLQETLERISQERTDLQTQLVQQQALCSDLQEQKEKLEAHVGELTDSMTKLRLEVKELTQRERLLVAFPELSPDLQGPPQSTGDVLRDMEQQMHANSVRIRVLERENATLHSTLTKLRPGSHHGDRETVSPQQESSSLPHTPAGSRQAPSPHPQPSLLQTSGSGAWRRGLSRNGASEAPAVAGPWDHASMAASSTSLPASSSASPSSTAQLHHQTLTLSPGTSAAKTYSKIRQASRARSDAVHSKRK